MSVLEKIAPVNQIGERLTGPLFQKSEKREEAQIRDK